MEFLFSEDQNNFAKHCSFLGGSLAYYEVRKLMEDDKGYDPEVWALLSNQLGLCGIAIAEQYGGAGFGPQELAIAERWAARCTAGPLWPLRCVQPTPSPKQRTMNTSNAGAEIASGDLIACLAVTEHAPMWSEDDVQTVASSSPNGGHVLNGEKRFVIDAQVAGLIWSPRVMAKIKLASTQSKSTPAA